MQLIVFFIFKINFVWDVTKTPINPSRTPTQIEQEYDNGSQYFLQVCTNLQNKKVIKEQQNKEKSQNKENSIKNTEDNLKEFDRQSIISQTETGLQLVYNKFNIVSKHYLLVQKQFIHQLEPIQSWKETVEFIQQNNEFTAFYNCGRESGSSQVRQHIQLLQLPEFTPLDEAVQQAQLIDQQNKIWKLDLFKGYKHALICFKNPYEQQTKEGLYEFNCDNVIHAYNILLKFLDIKEIQVSSKVIDILQHYYPYMNELNDIIKQYQDDSQVKNKIIFDKSYSLVLTNEYLFICLRSVASYFNSMSFSGYAFAKNEEIANKIKNQGLYTMLKECMVKE